MYFIGSKDVNTIILNISTLMPEAKFIPGKTCIILDEIQDCPDARTSLKSFKLDNRFDIIATGSLLGVKGYGNKKKKEENYKLGKNSVPVVGPPRRFTRLLLVKFVKIRISGRRRHTRIRSRIYSLFAFCLQYLLQFRRCELCR